MRERERNESHGQHADAAPAGGAAAPSRRWRAPRAWARKLAGNARRWPKWAWISGGALALLVLAALLHFALRTPPGWTLVVRGAPAGADVFVDNVRRGVTSDAGDILVPNLRAGNKLVKIVYQDKSEAVQVSGEDGDRKEVRPNLAPMPAPTATPAAERLPDEIPYKGVMVLIPAGEFIMGADDREENERPAHPVRLPDYYIDKYEVSNAQYKQFCDATGQTPPLNPAWSVTLRMGDYFKSYPDMPVIGVSWDEASAYCTRGVGKRLPTEEEWEKAASWGRDVTRKRQWPWGEQFAAGRANIDNDRPVNVKEFAAGASAYGVLNMAGNVSEWVDSFYLAYPGNTGTGEIGDENYRARYGNEYRVTRGGTFVTRDGNTVRTSRRDAKPPDSRTRPDDVVNNKNWLIGFRCAVSADDAQLRQFLRGGGQ
jgi:formylglycine-generating enzyme required for sulfatase activity